MKTKSFKFLIMLCGMPGVGKTTVARKLVENLDDYALLDQNELKRKYGYKRMPKTFDVILRRVDMLAARHLNAGRGVIYDAVNRRTARRQQVYGVASCCGSKVITLEVVCPETVAKHRMRKRFGNDGLVSDARDPSIYDKLNNDKDEVSVDFTYPGQDHVSHIKYDSHKNEITRIIESRGSKIFINRIERILTKL